MDNIPTLKLKLKMPMKLFDAIVADDQDIEAAIVELLQRQIDNQTLQKIEAA